jgi:hypothetical protein
VRSWLLLGAVLESTLRAGLTRAAESIRWIGLGNLACRSADDWEHFCPDRHRHLQDGKIPNDANSSVKDVGLRLSLGALVAAANAAAVADAAASAADASSEAEGRSADDGWAMVSREPAGDLK